MEVWKDIKGYEKIYQASNTGKIRTAPNKKTYTQKHGERTWKVRELKGRGDNYAIGKRVSLWKDGKAKDFLVARLVAFTFFNQDIDNHELTVNHIDGNRMNNDLSNLELISLGDNIRHGFRTGLYSNQKTCWVMDEKGMKIEFTSLSKAGEFFGKSKGFVSGLLKKGKDCFFANGKTYKVVA